MKKLLTLLLTLAMTICLINLNNSCTKAEDNPTAPKKIGLVSTTLGNLLDMWNLQPKHLIITTKKTDIPNGYVNTLTSPLENNGLIENGVEIWSDTDDSNITTMYIYSSSGFKCVYPCFFAGLNKLESVKGLKLVDFSECENFEEMFKSWEKIEYLDVSSIDTSNAKKMLNMFAVCLNLKKIKFGNKFDTSKVEDFSGMFARCLSLTELDLSSFDTSKAIKMNKMFDMIQNGSKLKKIIVSNKFKTNLVTDSTDMFGFCSELPNFDENIIDKTKAIDVDEGGYLYNIDKHKQNPSPEVKDESCEKVIGPTWHWNNEKGVCEEYAKVGTSTR